MSAGQIHDLGYKRYVGTRRSRATRWRVILRHQLASGWKTWWRFKVWLVAAFLVTAVIAGFLVLASDRTIQSLANANGVVATLIDGLLPQSVDFYSKIGFLVSLTIGATLVAGDLQAGAFTFYFARSLRPRDYVLGKLAGVGILMSLIMLLGPLVLAGLRLGLSGSTDQLVALLPVVPKALAVGALGTALFTAVPLGFSALVTSKRYALAIWAAYYLMVGGIAYLAALATTPALAAINLGAALHAAALHIFGLRMIQRGVLDIPLGAALLSIGIHVALAIAVMLWRVRDAQRTGVVSGS
jgi:hypothetical protein